jgi:iron(III) transport system permease protein
MSLSINAIKNSLFIAVVGASIGVIIAMIVAYIVQRTRLPGRRVLDYVSMFPIAIPGIVMAVGFLWSVVHLPMLIYGTVWIIIIAFYHAVYALRGAHHLVSPHAASSGTGGKRPHRRSQLDHDHAKDHDPLLKPAIVAGWILLFVTFMRELPTAILLYSPGSEVVSVAMYELVDRGLVTNRSRHSVLSRRSSYLWG